MRFVIIGFFAVLAFSFAGCDNSTANKTDTDTVTDNDGNGTDGDSIVVTCERGGVTYQVGDTIQVDCNGCICTESGSFDCTLLLCDDDELLAEGDDTVTDDTVDESTRPDGDTIGEVCTTIDDCSVGMFCRKAMGDCTGAGVCDAKPEGCTMDGTPVCGCDGRSYTNDCYANGEGVNVLSAGTCSTPVACSGEGVNGGCADPATYCRATNDACGGEGFCYITPLECPDWDFPVCACDGKTYPSRCHAEMEKQGILHDKECGSMIPCAANGECAGTEFCAKPLGSCSESVMGKCDNRPTDCAMTRAVAPQCGCDDYTYSNQCWAAAAGAVIAHDGECEGDVMCWGKDDCGENEYCQKKPGVCDMGFGVCRLKPADCPPPSAPATVCGCDLREYGDECTAWMLDVSVKHEGACNGPDDSMVRYFYSADAESPDGYLRIVVSPTDIREFWTADTFVEEFDGNNSVTLTVTFFAEGDYVPPDYAVLQYTLSLSSTLPLGIGFGYEGAYLKWYDGNLGTELGEMAGTVITYDYVQLNSGGKMPVLDVKGFNLSVK